MTHHLPRDPAFLAGDGEMAVLMRKFDWAGTSLGPAPRWPPSLKATVRLLLTSCHPGFICWGEDHRCLYNDAFRASLDDEHHPASLGQPGELGWPSVWPTIGPQIVAVIRGAGPSWHRNQRMTFRRQGELIETYWSCSYGPIDDESSPGGIGGVLALCTDTTEDVQRQHLMRLEKERFATLFSQAPAFMALMAGAEHRHELVNERYLSLIGRRDVIGRTLADVLPGAQGQACIERLDRVYRTGQAQAVEGQRFVLEAEPGQPPVERFVDLVCQPVADEDGRTEGVFVQGVDVTERRRVELALRKSEERFRLAVDSTGLGTFDILLGSGEAHLSEAGLALFGLAGSTPTLAELAERIEPEDRELLQSTLRRAFAEPDASPAAAGSGAAKAYHLRLRIRAGPNDVRHLSIAGKIDPGNGQDREPRATGIVLDLTEQQTLVDTLRTNDQRKDEFLATLAHELRNPLAALRSASYLLGRPGVGAERIRWCGEVIQRQSKSMALLLDDLMEVSRITRGKVELKREMVELQKVVDAAIETARPFLEELGHPLALALPAEPVILHADPLRVSQVLSNLLSNAARYSPAGSPVRLAVTLDAGEIRFEVTDAGIGIAPERLPKLFDMFNRSHLAEGGPTGGLGVGLAVSKGLIDLHGGRLEATSAGLGSGSTFTVTLPIGHGTPAESPPAGVGEPPPAGPRVLVADDNVDAAEAIATLLRLDGYRVDVVHDGVAALQSARDHSPFAAFLDIGMPGMDGYQLATQIRRQPWGQRLFLVAVTGWGQGADRDRALAAGFDLHLTKPIDLEGVAGLLARRLEESETGPHSLP